MIRDSSPSRSWEFFSTPPRPARFWGPSSLLYNGCQGPWEANSHSASQESIRLLRNPMVHNRVHKSLSYPESEEPYSHLTAVFL